MGKIFKHSFIIFRKKNLSSLFSFFKFFLVCLVPFVYGFMCSFAFWNPFDKINKLPIAIADHGINQNLYLQKSKNGLLPKISTSKPTSYSNKYNNTLVHLLVNWVGDEQGFRFQKSNSFLKFNINYKQTNASAKQLAVKYWAQLSVPKTYTFDVINFINSYDSDPGILNINYKNWKLSLNNNIKVIEGKVVSDAPSDKNSSYYKSFYGPKNNNYVNHNMKFYMTYQNNFLGAELLYLFSEFQYSFTNEVINELINTGIVSNSLISDDQKKNIISSDQPLSNSKEYILESNFKQELIKLKNYSEEKVGLFSIKPLITELSLNQKQLFSKGFNINLKNKNGGDVAVTKSNFNNVLQKNVLSKFSLLNIDKFMHKNIVGSSLGNYGIGLGQMFICIAIWVGIIFQTFLYKRDSDKKSINYKTNFWAKFLVFQYTSFIQNTILMLSLLMLGFSSIGASFGLFYLWILVVSFVFTSIIFGIWHLFKQADIGRFICVIFMILNLSAGWGTFPPILQNDFFYGLSYIMPFTYAMHGESTIIYGISISGTNGIFIANLFLYLFYLLIFAFFFLLIAFYLNKRYWLIKIYSTANIKLIKSSYSQVFKNNNLNSDLNKLKLSNTDWVQDDRIYKQLISIITKNKKQNEKK